MNMRKYIGVLLGLLVLLSGGARGRDETTSATRYGIALDLRNYPQGTAKETLASVFKPIEAKRVAYVVAQLAGPAFVDDRVQRVYGGRFEEQVEDSRARLDPLTVKLLQRFLKDGEWQEDKDRVTVRLKDEARSAVQLLTSCTLCREQVRALVPGLPAVLPFDRSTREHTPEEREAWLTALCAAKHRPRPHPTRSRLRVE
jgi:hypothetical protein